MRLMNALTINGGASASSPTGTSIGDGGYHRVLILVKSSDPAIAYAAVPSVSVESLSSTDYFLLLSGGINALGSTQATPINAVTGNRAYVADLHGARYIRVFIANQGAGPSDFTVDVYPVGKRS